MRDHDLLMLILCAQIVIIVQLALLALLCWTIHSVAIWLKLVFTPFMSSIPNIIRGTDGPPPTPADP